MGEMKNITNNAQLPQHIILYGYLKRGQYPFAQHKSLTSEKLSFSCWHLSTR